MRGKVVRATAPLRQCVGTDVRTMPKTALLTVHGMTVAPKDYADELIADLRRRVGESSTEVAFQSIYYQGFLHGAQRALWERGNVGRTPRDDAWRAFLFFGVGDILGLSARPEAVNSVYERAQIEIARKLLAARDLLGSSAPVVFVAHSHGAQVLSSYLYDAQRPSSSVRAGIWRDIHSLADDIAGHALSADEEAFLRGQTISCIVTTGCNVPMFIGATSDARVLPIQPPSDAFRWLNFYDPEDPQAWPLQPLGQGYETLVEDIKVLSVPGPGSARGQTPVRAHDAYWKLDSVQEAVVAALLGS